MAVFISVQALERAKKDHFVRSNAKLYLKEIAMIAAGGRNSGQAERIGEFMVSPRGHSPNGIRVAWHAGTYEGEAAYLIDDLLYHKSELHYVDNWNHFATSRQLRLSNYKPYLEFKGSLAA